MSLFVRIPTLNQDDRVRYINIIDGKTTAVQRQIRRDGLGGYEISFQATLLSLCGLINRPVFYDIGAHIGIYSALICSVFNNSICIAFEPTPNTHRIAVQIRDINQLPYFVARRGMSNVEGTANFFLSPKTESSNSLNPDFRPGAKSVEIKVMTLDRYLSGGSPLPNVIKIDVETHEPEVLEGARKTIEIARPWIMCELLPEVNSTKLANSLSWLEERGYSFICIEDSANFISCKREQVLSTDMRNKSRDWLLAPRPVPGSVLSDIDRWMAALRLCGNDENRISLNKLEA